MIVIGDVHGCLNTLKALLDKIPQEEKDRGIVLCGDFLGRGKKQKKDLIQFFIDNKIISVRGNHEQMFLDNLAFRGNPKYIFGFSKQESGVYISWIKKLPILLEFPDVIDKDGRKLLITHSSAGNYWYLKDIDVDEFTHNVLWNRDENIMPIQEYYNVFGHTPVKDPCILDNCADIDTGCVYGNKLTALQFPEMIVYSQDNIEPK